MILYHGSRVKVDTPDIKYSRSKVDFGKGFYVTEIKSQAIKWAERFKRNDGQGIVSKYEFDESLFAQLNILKFDSYNEEWLDFITSCREESDDSNYDIVIGGVANDKVFNTIELHLENLIDKSETIKRLRYEKVNSQICFRNQEIIDKHLKYIGCEYL